MKAEPSRLIPRMLRANLELEQFQQKLNILFVFFKPRTTKPRSWSANYTEPLFHA